MPTTRTRLRRLEGRSRCVRQSEFGETSSPSPTVSFRRRPWGRRGVSSSPPFRHTVLDHEAVRDVLPRGLGRSDDLDDLPSAQPIIARDSFVDHLSPHE